MQCDKSENCPAKKNPEMPCWEIVREINDDYRNFFNICRDCIVHVLKAENSVLSNQEIETIVEAKINCKIFCKQKSQPPKTWHTTTPPPG
jgi:hypothetical protein